MRGAAVVFLRTLKNSIKKSDLSLITLANRLSNVVIAILSGIVDKKVLKQLRRYGVDVAYFIDKDEVVSAYIDVVSDILMNFFDWEIGILPSDWWGVRIGGALSIRLKAGFVSNVVDVDFKGDELILKKEIFLGRALGFYSIKTDKKFIAVRGNLFPIEQRRREGVSTKEFFVDLDKDYGYEVESREVDMRKRDSDLIVSGGAGVGSKENFERYIVFLADKLSADIGASRMAVDKGYADVRYQVGQTGRKVSPNVYMAIGISGAIQHIAGITSAKNIIAINKDKNAPIFEYADYIVISDLFSFIKEFVKVLEEENGA